MIRDLTEGRPFRVLLLLSAAVMAAGAVLSYFLTPYMAVPAFVLWLVLFFKEVHFDAHKAFEKYLLK